MATPVTLGIDPRTRAQVQLPLEARKVGTYVIGRQGSGKTNLLIQIALTDIANGHGVCVLSPHQDLTEALLAQIPPHRRGDVIVFDPSQDNPRPVGINVFDWQGPASGISVDKVVDDVVVETFRRLWEDFWGPRMEEMMGNVSRTILYGQDLPPEHRPTLAEFARVIGRGQNRGYREFLLDHIHHQHKSVAVEELLEYWSWFDSQQQRFREEIASSTLNKARPFRTNELVSHVVGQGHLTRLDLTQLMDQGKILIADLNVDKLGTGNVELLGSLLIGRLFLAALSRPVDQPQPFHIIADEFGFFATPAFAALQDQARKFGVTVLVAHQRRGQLDTETRNATLTAGNWIVFSVNAEDAEQLAPGFDSEPPSPDLRGERLDLEVAQRPWDELKRQAPEELAAYAHNLERMLFVGTWKVYNYPGSELGDYLQWEQMHLDRVKEVGLSIWGFPSQVHRQNLEVDLNRLLYLLMTQGSGYEIEKLLMEVCMSLFRFRPSPEAVVNQTYLMPGPDGEAPIAGGSTALGKGGWVLANSAGDPMIDDWNSAEPRGLMALRDQIWDFVHQHKIHLQDDPKGWLTRANTQQLHALTSAFARTYIRWKVANLIVDLGLAMQQHPVWARGGQPIPEYERQRPFTDVTAEWQNILTTLPRYEAWCKVDTGDHVGEYHARTNKAPDPPTDAAQIVQQLRHQSSHSYGVDRAVVEEALLQRVNLDGIDADDEDDFPMSHRRKA